MNQYLSDKIRIISFLAIILVLYIHSGFHDYPHEISGMPFNYYLQDFISGKIGRCAVPLFFAISGFLFFKDTEGSICAVIEKMRRRVRTLLVPYFIAAVSFPTFFILSERMPRFRHFVNGGSFTDRVSNMPLVEVFTSVFVDAGDGAPWAFHLWFLRDLILIVLMAPILYYVRRMLNPMLTMVLLFIAYVLLWHRFIYDLIWFLGGSYYLERMKWLPGGGILFIMICLAEMAYPLRFWAYLKIPIVCLGVICLWSGYDKLSKGCCSYCKVLSIISVFTFFIYLYHEPSLNVVRKVFVLLLGHSSAGFAISYLLSPWLFVLIAIGVGVIMKRYLKPIYSVITGGR